MKKLIYTALILTSLITTTTIFAQEEFTKPQKTSSFTKPPSLNEEITAKDATFRNSFPYVQLGFTGVGMGYRSQTGVLGFDLYAKTIPPWLLEAGVNGLIFVGKSPVYFGAGVGCLMVFGDFGTLPKLNLLVGVKMGKKSFIQINIVDVLFVNAFSSGFDPFIITTSVGIGF